MTKVQLAPGLWGSLTPTQPLSMRAYNTHPLPAGENLRLGISGIRFSDVPRGVVIYHSTCFPVSMARGASWDVDLDERIGGAIGVDTSRRSPWATA